MIGSRIDNNGLITLFIKPLYGVSLKVGYLISEGPNEDGLLILRDKDNFYSTKGYQALGIDKAILFSKKFFYKYIQISFKGKKLTTTRAYFQSHYTEHNLHNGRNMCFLDVKKFNLPLATKWQKWKTTKQGELFDENETR